jgi:valyl-tRNA synthetase
MSEQLGPRYNHKAAEEKIYKQWEESGYFNPDNLSQLNSEQDADKRSYLRGNRRKKPRESAFCIIMPPPNANGSLHIGHAVFVTLQDIMIRFWRMRGKKTLWLPGADHAGFETQVVFDKKLEKEGRNRFAIDRETLWKEMWDFSQENKKIMEEQLRKLGASCDWSREKFTLDADIIKIVYETFEKLYQDGLVYRELRVVNWCPKHRTALSDLEVKYVEKKDPLYYIKYGPLTLATVRPETKFGDTALAVNPKDRRYQKYVGKEIEATGVLGPLKFKVIADEAVDPKFGTGVVKITPAHDAVDFEVWQRHQKEIPGPKIVIDENGRLTGEVGEYKGLKIAEARKKIAEAMQKIGILEKVDPNYTHQLATCYKCGTTLEPLPKPQWFVRMTAKPKEPRDRKIRAKRQEPRKSLQALGIWAVKSGKIKFIPKRIEKVYFHWLKNIRDWNISRQIVWGIRIPAWFHEPKCIPKPGSGQELGKCKEIIISPKEPVCKFCNARYLQDPDVFDTWFSSGQWPFATLKTTGKNDFETFYPTDVMETAYDILFFWVARMIMLGLYRTGKIPFKTVYIHGLVRDKDRQKMSKSKGNVIDPLGVAEIYGTDAVRMALVAGNSTENDIVISEDKIRGYRNFATKIWNVARFVLMRKPPQINAGEKPGVTGTDKKHLAELKKIKSSLTNHLEKFEFHLAAEKLYHYFWHTFADKIIEAAKTRLNGTEEKEKAAAYLVLETILLECLKMLHPFMPFISEEIYQRFRPGKMLMKEKW